MTREEAISIIERVKHTESKWPGTEEILEALDMATSAISEQQEQEDTVPVVRCRECKYGRECGDEISCYHPEYYLMEGVESHEKDFFCSYGEPKGKQMNHDATHCSDYQKGICPLSCYRAKLTEDLKWIHYDLQTSWSNFKGTNECLVWPKREEKDERETRASEKTPPAAGIH